MKHVIESKQFDQETISKIFDRTKKIRETYEKDPLAVGQLLRGKHFILYFSQPSTRTRFSFELAGKLLGGMVTYTENGEEFSSAKKGEPIEHTVCIFAEYLCSGIVIRHKDNDAAQRAAQIIDEQGYNVPVINGGCGTWQHPTQALIDLYAIQNHFGRLDDLTVVLGADLLNSRTVHSLVYLLSKRKNVRMIFVSPPQLRLRPDLADHLREHNVQYRETTDMHEAIKEADVTYWVRAQVEYQQNAKQLVGNTYDITRDGMAQTKEGSLLLHPMPITGEISNEVVFKDRRCRCLRQAGDGLFLRMALLCHLNGC